MSSYIEILFPGLFTSIQDRGRTGFRKFGVPISGAMDRLSAAMANILLKNSFDDAVMEITLSGPGIKFHADTVIVITGADLSPQLNDNSIMLNCLLPVRTGDVLQFGKPILGTRCYLAVKGGFTTDSVLGSRSFYKCITKKSRLEKGNLIPICKHTPQKPGSNASIKIDSSHFETQNIPCRKGPEFDMIIQQERKLGLEQPYMVTTDSNRMGYRLEATALSYPKSFSMLTSAVLPGTVQLTPSGQLIVLMQDCQTTGGYPRILQLTSLGVNQLAQKKAGDKFHFDLN